MKKLLFVPIMCLMFASCNMNSSGSMQNETEQMNLADWKTTLRVKEAILADSGISAMNRFVSVTTNDGVVTLSGSVSNEDQMHRIISTVENVEGVISVDNQLTIDHQ